MFASAVVTALVMLTVGCNSETGSPALIPSRSTASVEAAVTPPSSDPMEITATPSLLERLRVGEPSWAQVGSAVTVAARVEVDETRVTRVGSPVTGRVVEVMVREGQEVQRGQLLALVNSTGLSDAQLLFLKSLSQRQVAQRAVERALLLLKADVIGSAELHRREAELAQAEAELDAAHDQLMLLGMPTEAIAQLEKTRKLNSRSRVIASMAGTVLDRKVTLGQVVQPGDILCEIAELSHIWLVADVPERNAGHLAVGQEVNAEVAAFPGWMIQGKLTFVSAMVNRETHTVRVRMELSNSDRKLKPAMLATMVLKDAAERRQVVPSPAVVREGNDDFIFVQQDADTFVLRQVKLAGEYNGNRIVVEGVQPSDKIVVDGAFHLNNERRRRAASGSEGA
jgi:cobalt-zinc-cadmium efflux system membrane fusion protein